MNNEDVLILVAVNFKIPLKKTQISRKMAQYLYITGFSAGEQQLSEFLLMLILFFYSQGLIFRRMRFKWNLFLKSLLY